MKKVLQYKYRCPGCGHRTNSVRREKFFCEICGKKMKIESKDVYEPSRDPFELLVIGIITLFLAIFLAFTVVSMTI